MHIHQLNVSHHERQDRLLLRFNTQTAEEFRFWLTRRMALRLVPALEQTIGRLESTQARVMAPDPSSQKILTELKRDAFIQQADFKTPYDEQAQKLPLGDEPMLVTDVQLQLQGTAVVVTLQDKGTAPGLGQTCQLNLQASLLHGMIHLVRQAMDKAQWLTATQMHAPLPEPSGTPVTGYRH